MKLLSPGNFMQQHRIIHFIPDKVGETSAFSDALSFSRTDINFKVKPYFTLITE
jgi:hypothetical protein